MMDNQKENPAKTGDHKRFTDEHTDQRIHEHLTNEEDKISEEDIRNVNTDHISAGPQVAASSKKEKDAETQEEKAVLSEKIKNNDDTDINSSSWNVIDP